MKRAVKRRAAVQREARHRNVWEGKKLSWGVLLRVIFVLQEKGSHVMVQDFFYRIKKLALTY